MKAEIVHFSYRNIDKYGCALIERVLKFTRERELDADPIVLWGNLAVQMLTPNPTLLCIAAVEDEEVVGHLTASIINFHGAIGVFIESLSIDEARREGRQEAMDDGMAILQEWGRGHGATFIRAWAMNEALARVFGRFGLKAKPYSLVEMKLEGG
jgi:hypothetical protein